MRTIVLLLLAVLLVGALGRGGYTYWNREKASREAQEGAQDFVPSVRVDTAKREAGPITLSLPGQTTPFDLARIYARATGYIIDRRVDIGSTVKAGDLLARISAPDLDQQLLQATAQLGQFSAQIDQSRAQVGQAEANFNLARLNRDRSATLVPKGADTQQNLDNLNAALASQGANLEVAKAAVQVSEANLRAQKATVERLQRLTEFERLTAPFAGAVTARTIDNGDLVSADSSNGTALFTIARDDTLRVQVYVPQSAAIGIRDGLEAKVRIPEMPGRTFDAVVSRNTVALSSASRTLLVEVDVKNPDHVLRAGLYAIVDFAVPRTAPSITVPSEAIIFDSDGLRVATVDGDKARMRKVVIARDLGTRVELRDGLDGGERVILSPPADLTDGHAVKVQEPKPKDGDAKTAAGGASDGKS